MVRLADVNVQADGAGHEAVPAEVAGLQVHVGAVGVGKAHVGIQLGAIGHTQGHLQEAEQGVQVAHAHAQA